MSKDKKKRSCKDCIVEPCLMRSHSVADNCDLYDDTIQLNENDNTAEKINRLGKRDTPPVCTVHYDAQGEMAVIQTPLTGPSGKHLTVYVKENARDKSVTLYSATVLLEPVDGYTAALTYLQRLRNAQIEEGEIRVTMPREQFFFDPYHYIYRFANCCLCAIVAHDMMRLFNARMKHQAEQVKELSQ